RARRLHLHGELGLELTAGEQLDRPWTPHDPGALEPRPVHGRAGRRGGQTPHRDHLVLDPARVLEATFGGAPLERHLAALEPHRDLAPGARLLALVPLARGAADPGRGPLAAALPRARGAGRGMNGADAHGHWPAWDAISSTSTR